MNRYQYRELLAAGWSPQQLAELEQVKAERLERRIGPMLAVAARLNFARWLAVQGRIGEETA